jgi:S1-C subfamily serine protease
MTTMHSARIALFAVVAFALTHALGADEYGPRTKPPRSYGFAFTRESGETMSLKVSDVRNGSPAARAGLRNRDRIVAVDGRSDFRTVNEVRAFVDEKPSGEPLCLEVVRGDARVVIKVVAIEQRFSPRIPQEND